MTALTRVVIVDDEPLAREKLRTLLEGRAGYELVAECGDGAAAVEAIDALEPDLVFLDVEMPGLDGFGVLEALEHEPYVVFVTAYDRYALRAFEVRALDYLLKPFHRARFEEALARVEERRRDRSAATPEEWTAIRALLGELRAERGYAARLVVRTGQKITFVATADVDWIEADGNYARLHAGTRDYLLRETMKKVEARLDPRRFLRIHRSAIVNLDRIASVEPYFHGEYIVTLTGGRRITASRTHSARLRELIR
jgi:two-component system LytT family response regulator